MRILPLLVLSISTAGIIIAPQAFTQDPQSKTINVSFEPPVSPGTTFSISLQAKQNPSDGGIYLFTVNAFPAGEWVWISV